MYGNFSKFEGFRMNSLESNTLNFNTTNDWEFSLIYGGSATYENSIANDVYLFSLGKTLKDHYFYGRFTPGIKQQFLIRSDTEFSLEDSTFVSSMQLSYEERFGLGYSYKFSDKLSAGLSLRYFQQSLKQDELILVFSDTSSAITPETGVEDKKYWRGDIGFDYQISENFSFNLSTNNLFLLNENGHFSDNEDLELRTGKGAILGLNYSHDNSWGLAGKYETSNSFSAGINLALQVFGGRFVLGVSVYHDTFQNPYICCLMPSINFSSSLFSISLVAAKYLSDRTSSFPVSDLRNDGIHNILNNRFSTNKLLLTANFALSFRQESVVEIINVDVKTEIYPTLSDEYVNTPFAEATIVNISEKNVAVYPSSYIKEINNDIVHSPKIEVNAGDTALIPFYTLINRENIDIDKRAISTANFFISNSRNDIREEYQKPILVNDMNSWDGRVTNLRYFAKSKYQFSNEYSRKILNNNKEYLEKVSAELMNFEKTRLLFNYFVRKMMYVSDPRTNVEYVQFPEETIQRKGGDCDDLSVCFSGIAESVGIQTAFVDYKLKDGVSHVNLLVNTGLSPDKSSLITNNDKKYFVRKNAAGKEQIWLPVETTSLTDFDTAWSLGSDKFYREAVSELGLVKGKIEIVDIY
jgi:hypothetical protein